MERTSPGHYIVDNSTDEISLNYPVYFFTGGNFDYANGEVDISLSEIEMIDMELSSSDEEVSLSEYDVVKIDEYLIKTEPMNTDKTDSSLPKSIESNVNFYKRAIVSEKVIPSSENTRQTAKSASVRKAGEIDQLIAKWKPSLTCMVCTGSFSTFTLLRLHFRLDHPKEKFHIECCGHRFNRRTNIEQHLRLCHEKQVPRTQSKFKNNTYLNTEEEEAFIKHFMPSMKCTLCEDEHQCFASLNKHFDTHHPNDDAYILCCQRKFTTLYTIAEHIRVHLDENIFKCELCGKFQITKFDLDRHMLNQHQISTSFGSPERNDVITVSKNKTICRTRYADLDEFIAKWMPNLICVVCLGSYLTFGSLEKHFRENHRYKQFYILCCSNKFTTRHQLEEHIHLHGDRKGFPCEFCGQPYISRSSLYSHMCKHHPLPGRLGLSLDLEIRRRINKKLAPSKQIDKLLTLRKFNVKCGECYKICLNLTQLKEHFSYDHPHQEWYFSCCRQKLTSNDMITYHLRLQHDICVSSQNDEIITPDNRSNTVTSQEYEELITQWRPNLECMICHLYYPRFSLLKQHFHNDHHSTECYVMCCKRKLSRMNEIVEHILCHNDRKIFECKVCGECPTSRSDLLYHMCYKNCQTRQRTA